jgi:hypothetical protein
MSSVNGETGYQLIKRLARERREKVIDLLALAKQNDPYYCGAPYQCIQARWFADLWQRFGYGIGSSTHLRRVHYRVISEPEDTRPCQPNSTVLYENTLTCWGLLGSASKAARYLKLVPAHCFEDHRNPDPLLFAEPPPPRPDPSWVMEEMPPWDLPTIESNLGANLSFDLPDIEVSGYDYCPGDQPYLLEIWIEKSTMDDILVPLCEELGVNLVRGVGFQSITGEIKLLQRVQQLQEIVTEGRPVRVFYISDFDPAGDQMPVAVARQIQFWRPDYAPGADIKLTQLALTHQQCLDYALPRIPVKDTDKRKEGWEERYGEGATELDALEALHPGELERLVRTTVAPYQDRRLSRRLHRAEDEALAQAQDEWNEATREHQQELEDIEEGVRDILSDFDTRLTDLNTELQERLAPYGERLESVRQGVLAEADTFDVDLPERPVPETEEPDEAEWLFAADRAYLEQLEHYQRHKRATRQAPRPRQQRGRTGRRPKPR